MAAAETAAAFTYAWWLTGEDEAAARTVRAAAASRDVGESNGGQRLRAVLKAVRDTAADRTMCPASELALLHDGQGLDLLGAAQLAGVDPADAGVELAHGRLEALPESVAAFAHPERLGGLALGNPPDVAHARQCGACGHARELLERGRRELRDLAVVAVPPPLARLAEDEDVEPAAAADVSQGRLLSLLGAALVVALLIAGLLVVFAG